MNFLSLACEVVGLAVNAVERAVVHVDVVDGIGQRVSLVADNHYAILCLLACHVLHGHIANGGVEATAAHFLGLVVGIDFEHGLLALAHGDVAHVDVLDDATSA